MGHVFYLTVCITTQSQLIFLLNTYSRYLRHEPIKIQLVIEIKAANEQESNRVSIPKRAHIYLYDWHKKSIPQTSFFLFVFSLTHPRNEVINLSAPSPI